MSDKPPALPGPAGGSGAATPGTTEPTRPGARTFAPQHAGRYRREGLNERDALTELRRRRGGSAPDAGDQQAGAGEPPAQTQSLRQRRPGTPLPAAGTGPITPEGSPYSPLASVLDELPSELTQLPATPPATRTQASAPARSAPQLPGDPVFDLTVNNQPVRVALSELVSGYMRQQDYTAKTQANATQLKQAQDAQIAFTKAREALEARLPAIIATFAGEFEKPVDWVKLAAEDPIGYSQKDARFKQYTAALAEQRSLQELREREDTQRKVAMRQLGHEFLMSVLPGWRDPATRQQLQTLQTEHLKSVGYTPDEIANAELLDPRQIIILEESRRFRALVAAYPQLLRTAAMRPVPPQQRGDMPRPMQGNGRFDRQPTATADANDAERQWQELPTRTGAAARDAAVSLIAARRRASGAGTMAPLRPRRS